MENLGDDDDESKRTANELRFLNDLLEQGDQPVAVVHFDGQFVRFNRAYEQLTGYSSDELVHMSYQQLTPESWHEMEAEQVALLMKEGRRVRYEKEYRRKDGVVIPVEVVADIYRNAAGEPVYLYAFVTDITERKSVEEELLHRVNLGKLISSLSAHFINLASDKIDDGINYALKAIGEFAGVDRSYMFLYRDNGKIIDNTHEWCGPGIEPQISRLQGLPVDAFPWIMEKHKRGELVHIPRVSDLPPEASVEKEEFESEGIRSLIAIALMFGKSHIGFVGFDSVREEKTWDEETIELLKIVGEMFSNALAHRRSQEAIKRSFAQLSKKNRYETLISAVTRSVHQSIALQEVLENAVESMGENIDQASMVEIYTIEGEWAILKAHRGYESNYIEYAGRIPYPKGFIWKTAIEGKPIYCADVGQDTVIGPAGREAGIKSYLSMPIRFQGKIFGVIGINSFEKNVFDKGELRLLEIVSRQIETAINNAKQAEALREALSEVERLKNRLQVENIYLQEEIKTEHNFEEIVGQSEPLMKLLHNIEQVARTDVTVLTFGETGTGKELIARAVHNLSQRKDRPLVKVNCGAISAGLVESELFGHEKGAFTGALQRRVGRFELADGGTIFLDEVSELPLDTQTKLLRVLQEGELERVGSSNTIKVNVRVIAATNRNLEESVKAGSFRSDLFYRLNVFPLYVPPLRERKSDIPHLANFFITKFGKRLGKEFHSVSKETMNQLMSYSWPGNIRELQNVIERAVVLSQGPEIRIDVREPLHQGSTEMPVVSPVERPVVNTVETPVSSPIEASDGDPSLGLDIRSQSSVKKTLEDMERANILRVLQRTNWVVEGKRGAASILDMNPSTLRSRMRKLGIKKP